MALLHGKVKYESLGAAFDTKSPFRKVDERGEFALIVSERETHFVEFVEFLERGTMRAGHYHALYTEQFYVIRGRVEMIAKDVDTSELISIELATGSLVTINPGIAHVFRALTSSLAIAMGTGSNPFVDRVKYSDFS